MRIAYLIGHYPAVTHTFILREIQQLRRQGFEIETFSVWRADEQDLLTPLDRAEDARTYALLPPRTVDYLRCHLRTALVRFCASCASVTEGAVARGRSRAAAHGPWPWSTRKRRPPSRLPASR